MKKFLLTIAISIVSISTFSQEFKEAIADKKYDEFAYVDAIKTYERIFAKGYKSKEILEKLGNSYYFKADLDNAAKWYGELFSFTQDVEPEYYYRYAQSLKAIKDYERADKMLVIFNEKIGNDLRAKLAIDQMDYLTQIKKNSGRYSIEHTEINSKYSDYGSAFYQNKLIFATARDTAGSNAKINPWTGEGYTNLYSAVIDTSATLVAQEVFGEELNTKFHESTPTFTQDGNTIYFTRNNFLDGKKGRDDERTTLLKIYKATLIEGKWADVKELPFNSNEYSAAHPSLSADGKTLYFASNMPGTVGQSDLYKVAINKDGSYGKPINLGKPTNTEGRETFPMVTSNGELYFASDGHPGLGGLDIFIAKVKEDGTYSDIQNAGEPLNSSYDDFGFLINEKTRSGYITSNRDGGQGGDDIYKFNEIKIEECQQELAGVVTDKETGLAIAGAKITWSDANYKFIKEVMTDLEGKFDFGKVPCKTKYYIKSEKPTYTTEETIANTDGKTGKTLLEIQLEKEVKPVAIGDDLAKTFGIKIIYFDLDKSDIRPDAAIELAQILDVLEQNPTMELAIGSHTDSRQTAQYNQALSERRAQSTKAWLVSNGIDKNRLTAKGYGETKLVNNCSDGVPCTEEEHQTNRRSEFVITKI